MRCSRAPFLLISLPWLCALPISTAIVPAAQAGGSDAVALDREDAPLPAARTPFTDLFACDARWLVPSQRFAKWRDMTERAARNGGPSNPGWTNLISRLSYASPRDQIDGVQGAFNGIPYNSDSNVWGVDDYWASPVELLQRAQGDSEDIAIAKYYALRALGFSADKMRILVHQPGLGRVPEALLLVADSGAVLELNWEGGARLFQRGYNRRELYSLNEKYVWMHHQREEPPDTTSSGQIAETPAIDMRPDVVR